MQCAEALQKYILYCCQNVQSGGLLDKPGKSPDFYHSCYCLSGLSVSQHVYQHDSKVPGKYVLKSTTDVGTYGGEESGSDSSFIDLSPQDDHSEPAIVVGLESNLLVWPASL